MSQKLFILIISLSLASVGFSIQDGIRLLLNELVDGALDADVMARDFPQYTNEDWAFDATIYGYPLVVTTSGMVMGQTNKESHTFYSVPYAQPPVGNLRFKAPIDAEYSDEVIDASVQDFRHCYEAPGNYSAFTEDCLVVNVFTPRSLDYYEANTRILGDLPVLVWIHGGGFTLGAGTLPEANARLMANVTNTVVVCVNYRIAAFGFLAYEENGQRIEGNMGMKDQQWALRWVQKNIENFGGNKNMVTIFGQSAGAQAVEMHYTTESSRDLFHRGIIESAPAVFSYKTFQEASDLTEMLLDLIDCSQYETNMDCLMMSPPEVIYDKQNPLRARLIPQGDIFSLVEPYRPIIDGEMFTDQPINIFRDGLWHTDKELIIGTTTQEMAYVNSVFDTLQSFGQGRLKIGRRIFEKFNELLLGPEYYQSALDYYTDKFVGSKNPVEINNFDYTNATAEELKDVYFTCPSRALARYASQTSTTPQSSVYMYIDEHGTYKPPCKKIKPTFVPCGYADHASEIPFVFKSGPYIGYDFEEKDFTVSDMWTDYWGSFAHTGAPTSSRFYDWPPYLVGEEIDVRFKAPDSYQEQFYQKEVCDYWDETGFYFYPSPVFDDVTTPSNDVTTHTDDVITCPVCPEPEECPASVTKEVTPQWVIIVLCLLAALIFLETIALLYVTKSNNNAQNKLTRESHELK